MSINYFEDEDIQLNNFDSLEGIEFIGCVFKSQDFTAFSLKNIKFIECEFLKCNLSNANLSSSSLRDVKFLGCKLVGVNWTVTTSLSQLVFRESILDLCVFQSLELSSSEFIECSLKESDFTDTKLKKSKFNQTNLADTVFNNADCTECDFTGAYNYYMEPEFTKIKKAKFSMPEAISLFKGMGIIVE